MSKRVSSLHGRLTTQGMSRNHNADVEHAGRRPDSRRKTVDSFCPLSQILRSPANWRRQKYRTPCLDQGGAEHWSKKLLDGTKLKSSHSLPFSGTLCGCPIAVPAHVASNGGSTSLPGSVLA